MSKLTKLLDDLCPDGVFFQPLKELGRRNKGIVITAGRMKDLHTKNGEVRVFAGGQTTADVDRASVSSSGVIDHPSIVVKSRGHIGFEYYEKPFTHKNELWSYTLSDPGIDQKFVFYYLQSNVRYFQLKAKSGKLPQIGVRDTDQFPIPVPPLEVQQETVRVLDALTDLEQSLVSELELRKKQFEEFRKFTFRDIADSELRTLGDVSRKVTSGATPKASNDAYYEGGEIPWLRTSEVNFGEIWDTEVKITTKALEETAVKWIPENCLVVAISGATAGRSAINRIRITTNQHCCCLNLDPNLVDLRYAFHWIASNYPELKGLGRGVRGDLNSRIIKSFGIPIPPLDVQQSIASKLDAFDALIHSIEHEIVLRRKQYAFYRDELLSFTPKEA